MKDFSELGASWIWHNCDAPDKNQYVEFHRQFDVEDSYEKARLYISADTDYVAWVNGVFAGCGQYSDYPWDKTYDELDISGLLRIGENTLCILVYYMGETFHTYLKGDPGLLYALVSDKLIIPSDENTRSRQSAAYLNGLIPKITSQLAYTFAYDAVKNDGWPAGGYKVEGGWTAACIRKNPAYPGDIILKARPVKKLSVDSSKAATITAQGLLLRKEGEGESEGEGLTVARQMQLDYLSSRTMGEISRSGSKGVLPSQEGLVFETGRKDPGEGIYLVIDLGREETGILQLDLDASSGTIVDMAFGEHLDDLRVRSYIDGRNFAARYICREGRQNFVHYTRRLGFRYLQLNISNVEKFVLYYAGIKPTEYPVLKGGAFTCSDSLHNHICKVGVRTLELCMHEHYEDTPWREQSLYSMDARNQALCGYYCFGDYGFPLASIDLLGKGVGENGFLQLTAPTKSKKTIPCFSMVWIMWLWEHYMYSGSLDGIIPLIPVVKQMLEIYAGYMEDGLMLTPRGSEYWHFYEWSEGLDGCAENEFLALASKRFDAPLNLFFLLALKAAVNLTGEVGDENAADRYRSLALTIEDSFHRRFWSERKQAYVNYLEAGRGDGNGEGGSRYGGEQSGEGRDETRCSEFTQALALYACACPPEIAPRLRQRLAFGDQELVETTLSHTIYKFSALLQEPEEYGTQIFEKILRDWGHMLFRGATSFWETVEGASAFEGGGSLSHGWSAVPVYFYYAYVLGVKPLEPGFKTFEVRPLACGLDRAQGKVPTPYGEILVDWINCDGKIDCSVTHPKQIKRVVK